MSLGTGAQRALLSVCLFAAILCGKAGAADVPEEYEVKAIFVLNFIKFVEWPPAAFPSPEDSVVLSVVGRDRAGEAIAGLQGKTVIGRKIVVRSSADAASVEKSHVVFIGASEKGRLPEVLHALRSWPVLTIADFDGFAGRGGMIGFVRLGDRVGFEINEDAARKAGLKISARLLYLGRSVSGRPGEER